MEYIDKGIHTGSLIETVLVHERDLRQAHAAYSEAQRKGTTGAAPERVKAEFDDAKEFYGRWKGTLDHTEPPCTCGGMVAIMERPNKGTEIPIGGDPFDLARESPALATGCYASALVLSFLFPRKRPKASPIETGDEPTA
jgi:hypothetical protein